MVLNVFLNAFRNPSSPCDLSVRSSMKPRKSQGGAKKIPGGAHKITRGVDKNTTRSCVSYYEITLRDMYTTRYTHIT